MSRADIRIEGFIANDLEVRDAGSHRVVEVSVPHTPSKKNDAGQEDSGPTTWFSATFWNEHADHVLDSVQKSDLVILSGSAELEVYMKRDGTTPGGKVKVTNPVIAKVVRKPRRDSGGGGAAASTDEPWATAQPATQTAQAGAEAWNVPNDDSTPF